MRKFGIIGYPLGHSFSKKYFTEKFLNEHISDCSYENYPLTSLSQLNELVDAEPSLCGLNVTIPYKSDILSLLNVIDREAREIGAVNVLKIKRLYNKTELYGYNSDITGIRDTLNPYVEDCARKAIVLGTGGSSKAVCYVLEKLNFQVILISRNPKPGTLTYSGINSEVINSTALIINTTPLGMFPDILSKPDINYSLLSEKHILFDLVYNPVITPFLAEGKKRGCTTLSGLKMLHSQAEKAWEIWNDNRL